MNFDDTNIMKIEVNFYSRWSVPCKLLERVHMLFLDSWGRVFPMFEQLLALVLRPVIPELVILRVFLPRLIS